MTKHDKAVIERLLRIPGAKLQRDRVKTRQVKLPKKPRKKSESTGMIGLKIERNVIIRDNERVGIIRESPKKMTNSKTV